MAAGARHEAAGADHEAELGLAAEEEVSDASELEDWSMGDWIAGTGVNLEVAEAEARAGVSQRVRNSWMGLRIVPVAHKEVVLLWRLLLLSHGGWWSTAVQWRELEGQWSWV